MATNNSRGCVKIDTPLFNPPLLRLSHNSLFTAVMLLISNKIVCWASNSLCELLYGI